MLRFVDEGATVSVWNRGPRDSKGQYSYVDFLVTDSTGKERMFRLRGESISQAKITSMVVIVEGRGAVMNPSPSLDISDLGGVELDDYGLEEE
jgi:hypothetical protein